MINDLNGLLELNYSINSHKRVEVCCAYNKSKNCRNVYTGFFRDLLITAKNHNNLICCMNCSRILKASHVSKGLGRTNLNTKYKKIDDNYLSSIDTEEKAYVLGWLASDGSFSKSGVSLSIKDKPILETIRNCFSPQLPLKCKSYQTQDGLTNNIWTLNISSKQISSDCQKHLGLEKPGKKSHLIDFPKEILTDDLKWHFLRGYFEGDGTVNQAHGAAIPKCSIASNSKKMRDEIQAFCKIPCSNSNVTNAIYFSGNNALDFMAKMYDVSSSDLRLSRKYMRYLDWTCWVPALHGQYKNALHVRFNKTLPEAIIPSKERATDVGYDLTAISIWKKMGNVTFYETGIRALPDFGWWLMLAPRSSITKTGYMLANSIGILDRSYVGTIKIPLIKIDPNAEELQLPIRIAQVIPSVGIHAIVEEVSNEEFEEEGTSRANKGFGSSGR